ncbi:type II toxin-antitoxin system RelE/ParE family toxin [uncultured Tateyamaria sp.]|uniref:type II toxin-antitoxin system RelE/ParE family toxin n=1 Tax=uncultured Tateyamaria sp. TaxID=455651 RepID=UPI00261D1DB3|nr:type II toxin-antitoxin system RelE/ParE family toxin [uncultured Tateyamaria sp.]
MSGYKVSKKAVRDITSIGEYTQKTWGLQQRRAYLSGLERAFERLSQSPKLAPLRSEIDPPVRVYRYESHLIVYKDDEDGILVLRVRHHSEDWIDSPL